MLKRKSIVAGIAIFMFGLTTFSFAQMKCMGHSGGGLKYNSPDTSKQDSQKNPIEAGNKICPVLNEKIDEENRVIYVYEGKAYNFCCQMCVDEFKKDPEKYIKKIEEEKNKNSVNLKGDKR